MPFSSVKRVFFGHAFNATHQTNRLIHPFPEGYTHHDTCRAFLEREAHGRGDRFHFIEDAHSLGLTWKYGPLRFARFLTDHEPTWNNTLPRPHFLFWQRIAQETIPPSWKHSPIALHQSRIGISSIPQEGDPLLHISSHAKRHVQAWKKQAWVIEPITLHEYWDVAFRSTLFPGHKKAFNISLAEKIAAHGNRVCMVGARPADSVVYEAAFSFINVPEIHVSLHQTSCATTQGRAADAGTGLMAWWLEHLQQTHYRYADFGLFFTPGEPNGWKGFSRFKAQFCTSFHDFPPILVKKRSG